MYLGLLAHQPQVAVTHRVVGAAGQHCSDAAPPALQHRRIGSFGWCVALYWVHLLGGAAARAECVAQPGTYRARLKSPGSVSCTPKNQDGAL